MHGEHLLYIALFVSGLLTLATVVHVIAKRFHMPFAVGLLFAGLILSVSLEHFFGADMRLVNFSPEIIFYVFLPTLIFESAYHIKFRQFRGVLREVVTLASLGLLVSALLVAAVCHYVLQFPWSVSLLFGALISATDPVAVLSIFKELKVPKKLVTIVDGESLINDGTALVAFQFLLKFVLLGGAVALSPMMLGKEVLYLGQSIILGLIVGTGFGVLFATAIARSSDRGVQLTLSVVLAHITFLVAEGLLGVSGILATLAAGLVMGNWGRRKLAPATNDAFVEIWNFLGFISNALVFLLLGLKLGEIEWEAHLFAVVVASVAVLLMARPVSVLISFGLTNLTHKKLDKVGKGYQIVTMWGGIRGALAAAAVLLIPESFAYAEELQAMTAGVIVASFLLNAMTIKWLLKKVQISTFTKADKFQQKEAELIINEEILSFLDRLLDKKYISDAVHIELKHRYAAEHDRVGKGLKKLEKGLKNNNRALEKILTHFALGIELKTYRKLFALREVSEERFVVLRESIDRQLDRLEHDVLPDERQPKHKYAPEVTEKHISVQVCQILSLVNYTKKLKAHYKTKRVVSRLQHYRARRISSWKVVRDFERLSLEHPVLSGSPVVGKIINRYKKWNQNAEKKMHELEVEFPEIVIPYRIAMADKACLARAKKIEKDFMEKGFISEKIYDSLKADLNARTKACEWRPGKK